MCKTGNNKYFKRPKRKKIMEEEMFREMKGTRTGE